MKKGKGVVTILVVLICVGLLGWYASTIISNTSKNQEELAGSSDSTEAVDSTEATDSTTDTEESTDSSKSIKLGLDLSGGVSVTYSIVDDNPSQTDIDDTIAKLEERASSYSTEYSVYQVGDDRITVEIPGVYNANEVLEKLGSPGSLYFIKHTDSDGNENYSYDSTTGEYELNYTIEELEENGSIIFDGNGVKNAEATYEGNSNSVDTAEPVVRLEFNDEAAELWADATEEAYNNSCDSIGVYYDDHFISVPNVQEKISGGVCTISGQSDYSECEELATFIRVGAMKLELKELTASVVGAQLGGKALSTSLKAAIIGIILVMLFMIIMYGLPGVASSLALAVYTTLVMAFIYWFEITLTLPGIAGIILGIGMAVDANVITFARIREEIASGKPVLAAIKEGYKKAFSAILDGNVTTFIAAVILMLLGSGTVKGFAYTLMISIILSMFSALVVARLLMYAFYGVGFKDEKFYGRAKERKAFDFIGHRKIFFGISIAVIAAGIIGMVAFAATGNGMLNFSLEFKGGTSTTADMGVAYTVDELESDVTPVIADALGISESAIQVSPVTDSTDVTFKTTTLSLDQRETLNSTLVDSFGVDESSIESESISSTISGEMRRDAILAVIVSCIFMLLYIWFRFKDIRFATSAILALVHDVLVVLTSYALIRISVGNTFIACMLTIVGYSINDTIVIFDRIRENLHGVTNRTPEELAEVANRSLTQTLSRSINTSITTIIMVLLLFIMGVSSIREFALPMLVGMICGSYSSIFIATELWYLMKLHLGKNKIVKKN